MPNKQRIIDVTNAVKGENPTWNEDQVTAEVRRRLGLDDTVVNQPSFWSKPAVKTTGKIIGGVAAIVGSAFLGYKVGLKKGRAEGLAMAVEEMATIIRPLENQEAQQATLEANNVRELRAA